MDRRLAEGVTTTAAVYPEVAALLEALDPDWIKYRKARAVDGILYSGELTRAEGRDLWIFLSTDIEGQEIRVVVDCRDLAFAPSEARPNQFILRSVWKYVEQLVDAAIDAEVQNLLDPSVTATDVRDTGPQAPRRQIPCCRPGAFSHR